MGPQARGLMADETLTDTRTGRNGRDGMVRQRRQSVFGRVAGYDDMNDADLVWPLGLEDRLRAALAPYIADPRCRDNPTAYFLPPKTGALLSFTCLGK